MFLRVLAIAAAVATAMPALAQSRTKQEAMRIAKESRMCGDLKILRAEFRRHGNVGVLCEGGILPPVSGAEMGTATNFVPLIGGLGPILGLGGGALVVSTLGGGGSSTSDTQ